MTDPKKQQDFLTETILSIHNEIQSALDYISTKATEEGTEFGKSTAILSIQNLRIKIPLKIGLETIEHEPEQPVSNQPSTIVPEVNLLDRQGFVLYEAASTSMNLVDTYYVSKKLAISLPAVNTSNVTSDNAPASTGGGGNSQAQDQQKEVWGELEITFSPIKRQ